ncbi:MAG: hypothetical protein LBM78_04580, partial [Clostridiales bacterium]|nr:hypothetical protein [Clostridiales bacterium]
MQLIRWNAHSNALNAVADALKKRTVDLSVRHFVLVPDRYTLEVERTLARALGGFFDVEVVTLSRLALRLGQQRGDAVSKSGAALLTQEVLDALRGAGSLVYFTRAAGPAAAATVYDAALQLKAAGVTAAALDEAARGTSGTFGRKLADLAAVLGGYEQALEKHGLKDATDHLAGMEALCGSPLLTGAHLYLLGYDALPHHARQFLRAADARAASVTVHLRCDRAGDVLCRRLQPFC